jgi:hypothetical protein
MPLPYDSHSGFIIKILGSIFSFFSKLGLDFSFFLGGGIIGLGFGFSNYYASGGLSPSS